MANSQFTCPHCLYEAPLYMFENVNNGKLKCKRCCSNADDPNAYSPEITYADCDSRRVINRFPFLLDGENSVVFVQPDYMALVIGNDGSKTWLRDSVNRIDDMPGGFQLYHICLKPQINWGIKDIDDFGAYGVATLSLSPEYVESFCAQADYIHAFEEHLQSLVAGHITEYVRNLANWHSVTLLRHSDGYINALGVLAYGVSMTKIEPKGYRDADSRPVVLSVHNSQYTAAGQQEDRLAPAMKPPVEKTKPAKRDYTVEWGIEEVFIRNGYRTDRHKAGEVINVDSLQDVNVRLRFSSKEFEFANGWGLYNQECSIAGYFSAHGTISFYIDSTERMSQLVAKPSSWEVFEEEFFTNVLKKEAAGAIKGIIEARIVQKNFDPDRVSDYLSALSIEMTSMLNGETEPPRKPAFMQHGLRVKRVDIYNIDFYPVRR